MIQRAENIVELRCAEHRTLIDLDRVVMLRRLAGGDVIITVLGVHGVLCDEADAELLIEAWVERQRHLGIQRAYPFRTVQMENGSYDPNEASGD